MQLNGDKCESIRYGITREAQTEAVYKSSTGSIITEKAQVRDLGIMMSNTGQFKDHIHHTTTEAKKQCSWILRTFCTREKLPMLTLWKSLVQSRLEYCSQLWCPLQTGDIQNIEMVQRSFIRKITDCRSLNYWEQLKYLHLYSLERRRERYRIIYIWRMLEEQVPNIFSAEGIPKVTANWHVRRGRECAVHRVNRRAPSSVQKLVYASLPVHGQQLFNTLPSNIRNLTGCSLDKFKRELDRYLATIPDEPQIPGYTAQRRADSNSLLDMTRLGQAYHKTVLEVPGDTHTVTPGSPGVNAVIAVT